MKDNNQNYLFYLWGMPKNLATTFFRTVVFTLVFALLELAEEYYFGLDFYEALLSSVDFVINVFPKLFVLFFLMTVIPRLKSQHDFLKKSQFENKTAREIYALWLNKN